jgi:K+-transporting ATPase ATPase A chain
MTLLEITQVVFYFSLLIVCTPLLGGYMKRVFDGERTILSPVLRPVEGFVYRLGGIRPEEEQRWQQYALALLVFNVLGFLALFLLQWFQGFLPLNPEGLPGVEPFLAFNTASSFMTNTNWQAYAGETTVLGRPGALDAVRPAATVAYFGNCFGQPGSGTELRRQCNGHDADR